MLGSELVKLGSVELFFFRKCGLRMNDESVILGGKIVMNVGEVLVNNTRGVQQGDPLGPALFLAGHPPPSFSGLAA